MKQISARQFRVSFGDLTEPVTVLRRHPEGGFIVLGEWVPAGALHPVPPWPAVTFDKDLSRDRAALGLTPLERATATVKAGFGTGRPAPKPSKAKK